MAYHDASEAVERTPRVLHRLIASGLPRLVHHMLEDQFGIISAYRGELDRRMNAARDRDLRHKLRETNLGYSRVRGLWRETDLKTGIAEVVTEQSLFVAGASRELLRELAGEYGQEAFLWGDGGKWHIEATKTGEILEEGDVAEDLVTTLFSLHEEEGGFTEVKGRPYTLVPPEKRQKAAAFQFEIKGRRFALVPQEDGGGPPYFFSVEGDPPYVQRHSGVKTGRLPEAGALEAWFPLDSTPVP